MLNYNMCKGYILLIHSVQCLGKIWGSCYVEYENMRLTEPGICEWWSLTRGVSQRGYGMLQNGNRGLGLVFFS